ncbi:hypothetical protein [Mesonia sp. K7]|uniref:hypothetical protein n=1 Tax=Mesonia sp. K7 TaxID=2218606 RepID=UPI000DA78C72|nr:hypothetical protein [Mesonia sp. K7]PZD79099.1 hypothetical protein DNG35_03580 [Mesonia sp. K7]
MVSLEQIETELKKRHQFPYRWMRKQNNAWDKHTNFIYKTQTWKDLCHQIENASIKIKVDKDQLFQYAANRWYNFWSAKAIEQIFTSCENVRPVENTKSKTCDFYIENISFDHKTSVFPKRYPKSLSEAQQNPCELLHWLYQNQSQQGRKHLKNRLFLVVYQQDQQHWKLKAEIKWLSTRIKNYVFTFDAARLTKLNFKENHAFADIIWAVR